MVLIILSFKTWLLPFLVLFVIPLLAFFLSDKFSHFHKTVYVNAFLHAFHNMNVVAVETLGLSLHFATAFGVPKVYVIIHVHC